MKDWEYTPCHVCEAPAVTDHEPIHGTADRKQSRKYGLMIPVCEICHDMFHKKPETNEPYKKEMQLRFEETHTHEEFMEIFKRNYL